MTTRRMALALLACMTVAVSAYGGQLAWRGVGKKQTIRSQGITPRVGPVVRPAAVIGGGANGVYCTEAWDNGISVHDLGYLPAGVNVTVTVESMQADFNPVAAVVVPQIGQVGSSRVDLQACKLEYSIVSPK